MEEKSETKIRKEAQDILNFTGAQERSTRYSGILRAEGGRKGGSRGKFTLMAAEGRRKKSSMDLAKENPQIVSIEDGHGQDRLSAESKFRKSFLSATFKNCFRVSFENY